MSIKLGKFFDSIFVVREKIAYINQTVGKLVIAIFHFFGNLLIIGGHNFFLFLRPKVKQVLTILNSASFETHLYEI